MKVERHSFDTLNLLRGLAALTVLLWHFTPLDGKRFWSAYLSVDLFFVLSGVVVAHAYEERLRAGWRFWRFVAARMIRLWPLYLLGGAVGAVALAAATASVGHEAWRFKPLAFSVARACFLLPEVGRSDLAFPLDPPAWSLFCEFVVNLAYGAVLVRWRSWALGMVAVVGIVGMVVGANHFAAYDVGLNLGALVDHLWVGVARALFGFPAGVLIYRCWRRGLLPRLRVPPIALAGAFLLLLFIVPGEGPWATSAGLLAVVIVFPLLVALAVQVEPHGATLRAARITADLSYPIYALHDAFYLAAALLVAAKGAAETPAYVAALAAALVAAPLADRLVDRPIRRVLSRLIALPRAAVVNAAPL